MDCSFRNATIVLADEVVTGSVHVTDGEIAAVDSGTSQVGEDFGGDYLIPGLVELHTDQLENHYRPRPGVFWNTLGALQSHDVQISGSGITTVFDAVRIGEDPEMPGMRAIDTEQGARKLGASCADKTSEAEDLASTDVEADFVMRVRRGADVARG